MARGPRRRALAGGAAVTVEFCLSEQLRCAGEFHDAGARLGLHDWFAEEFLMEIENHIIAPGPDHPAYAVDREDPGDRDDRIHDRWKDEEKTNA